MQKNQFSTFSKCRALKWEIFGDRFKMLQFQLCLAELPIEFHKIIFDQKFILQCMKFLGSGDSEDDVLLDILISSIKYWDSLINQVCVKHLLPLLHVICKAVNQVIWYQTIRLLTEIVDHVKFDDVGKAFKLIETILKDLALKKQLQQMVYIAVVNFQMKKQQLKVIY